MTDANRSTVKGPALAALVGERIATRAGEFAVLGLGLSGEAAAKLLHRAGVTVYASDFADSAEIKAAAKRLSELGVHAQARGHDLNRIANASCVVVSPGIPPTAPPLKAAMRAGVPVVSEIEIGLQLQPSLRYIAVTGTNGKTTTTALVAHLLNALGKRVVEAGNIGTPLCAIALQSEPPEWVALELSSFQLHDTPSVRPTVGVLTNLSPDHLDRYNDNVHEYYADKALMFVNANSASHWVVSADSGGVADMIQNVTGTIARFSTRRTDVEGYLDRARGQLVVLGEPLARRADFPLPGDHNVANLLAALLAVMTADPEHATAQSRTRLAESLSTFAALPHRIEPVANVNDVLWLNDSKATNVSSTLVAVAGMTRPTILLLGGRHKGEPYTALAESLGMIGKAVLAYGESAELIYNDLMPILGDAVPVHLMKSATFKEVMAKAHELAEPGDAVLLSPACSSYDMFANYKERGRTFAELARAGA